MRLGIRRLLQNLRPSLCHLTVLAAAGLGVACASGGQSEGTSRSRDVITLEEIQEANSSDPYEAVRRLRSSWLRTRSPGVESEVSGMPIVYVDNVRLGDIEMLRSVPILTVVEIRRISASDATTRWGTGFPNGAIEVITRR